MTLSTITIDVQTDEKKIPAAIHWSASDTGADKKQAAKAMMIAFWDAAEKAALRIDLWTQDMMVDEMADFFYQTLMTMADTFSRSTHQQELADDMKRFGNNFIEKFRSLQLRGQENT